MDLAGEDRGRLIAHESHQMTHDGRGYWLEIRITAKAIGDAESGVQPGAPFPVKADLGRRVADLVQGDATGDQPAVAVHVQGGVTGASLATEMQRQFLMRASSEGDCC